MALSIERVTSKKGLKSFIKFQIELYKGNPYYVPPLIHFELSTLQKSKNPAFDAAKAEYWIVKKDRRIVGRIAALILNDEFDKEKTARFGWVDFIDDKSVSSLLFDTAISWAKQNGATQIHGPLGFTDFDFEGALVNGYDLLATQASIYNHPYYIKHYEEYGFTKAVDWIEARLRVPDTTPDRIARGSEIISKRYNLKVEKLKKAKDGLKYAPEVFEIINESYSHLYGYYPLSEKQINYYVDLYFGFIKKEFVVLVLDSSERLIGFTLTVPSFSKAFQKAKGHLYPFGFVHVLNAFRKNDSADWFLIGIRPEYQKLGVNAIILNEMNKAYNEHGIIHVSTGPMLDDNMEVLNFWSQYKKEADDIRRRCYIKNIK